MVHTLLMAIQSTFDIEPQEFHKRYEKNGRVTAIILVQNSPKWHSSSEQFARTQSEQEHTLGERTSVDMVDQN